MPQLWLPFWILKARSSARCGPKDSADDFVKLLKEIGKKIAGRRLLVKLAAEETTAAECKTFANSLTRMGGTAAEVVPLLQAPVNRGQVCRDQVVALSTPRRIGSRGFRRSGFRGRGNADRLLPLGGCRHEGPEKLSSQVLAGRR